MAKITEKKAKETMPMNTKGYVYNTEFGRYAPATYRQFMALGDMYKSKGATVTYESGMNDGPENSRSLYTDYFVIMKAKKKGSGSMENVFYTTHKYDIATEKTACVMPTSKNSYYYKELLGGLKRTILK